MAFTEAFSGSAVTISSTEFSLTNSSTTLATQATKGNYTLWVDLTNLAAGDQYEISVRDKIISGGTQRKVVLANFTGAQAEPFVAPGQNLYWGWDFTIKKIAGTDRAFDWSIRAVT